MCWEIFCQSLKEDVISQDFKHAIKVFFFMVVHVKPLDSLKISTCQACFSGRWLDIVWFWFLKPFTHFKEKRSMDILENVSISVKKIFFSILNQKGYHDSRQKRNTTILENVSNLVLKNLLVNLESWHPFWLNLDICIAVDISWISIYRIFVETLC